MGYLLEKDFRFEAAHRLPDHDGKCARLHGHSWRAVVRVAGTELSSDGPKRGMLVDYGALKAVVAPVVDDELDHRYLNDVPGLEYPTSEVIARWLHRRLSLAWVAAGLPGSVESVTVEETCTARCTYRP